MTVSKRLRYEVLRRDNHACRYCGLSAPAVELRVDHVIPVALGGSDDPSNLVAACEPCNTGKSSSAPDAAVVEQVNMQALRMRDALRLMAEVASEQRQQRDLNREFFHDHWIAWTYLDRRTGERCTIDLPNDWPTSIDGFFAAGLTPGDINDAINAAMRREGVTDEFKYFCGVCWTMIRQRHADALDYLASQEATGDGA